MCGRATLATPGEEVARLFDVEPIDVGPARYNIAPTQPMLVVRERVSAAAGPVAPARELSLVRWGLVPWWTKPEETKAMAGRCIQARAETAARAPAFRDAVRSRRCLVVVDGFFEWKTLDDGRRVPHHVRRRDRRPFAIAGVWDAWRPPGDPAAALETCAVVTVRSAGALEALHDRMPLVLADDEWSRWVHDLAHGPELLASPPRAERTDALEAVPVSTWVNDVRHDDARCIEPTPIAAPGPGILPHGQIDFGFADAAPARARRSGR